ncbi:MAG: cytochrome C oxidase subunit IV family protein [Thiobacillus sp.]
MTSTATFQWLILIALTAVAVTLSQSDLSDNAILVPVLLATLVKGRIVIDRFMALQGVAAPWRWIVLGWLLVVLGLIGYTFHLTQP